MAPSTVRTPLLAPRKAFQPDLRPPRNPDESSSGTTTFAAVTRVTLTVDIATFLSREFNWACSESRSA